MYKNGNELNTTEKCEAILRVAIDYMLNYGDFKYALDKELTLASKMLNAYYSPDVIERSKENEREWEYIPKDKRSRAIVITMIGTNLAENGRFEDALQKFRDMVGCKDSEITTEMGEEKKFKTKSNSSNVIDLMPYVRPDKNRTEIKK